MIRYIVYVPATAMPSRNEALVVAAAMSLESLEQRFSLAWRLASAREIAYRRVSSACGSWFNTRMPFVVLVRSRSKAALRRSRSCVRHSLHNRLFPRLSRADLRPIPPVYSLTILRSYSTTLTLKQLFHGSLDCRLSANGFTWNA